MELNRFAEDLVAQMAPLALRQGRELALLAQPSPCWVTGDAAALAEALSNLIENAIVFTRSGSVVEVEVMPHAIRVLDHGSGVADGDKATIFARFHRSRGSQSASRRHDGAGLGLGIALEIMRRHGGSVTVNDRKGGGAIFSLVFPAPPAAATEATALRSVQPVSRASTDSSRLRLTPKSEYPTRDTE